MFTYRLQQCTENQYYSPIDEQHSTEFQIPYGASKLIGEVGCYVYWRTYRLPIVIGRPFCVYGPGENPKTSLVEPQRYLRWHLNHVPIRVVGDLDKKVRDFVHVTDLVEGLLALAENGGIGEAYNIGSGTETSMQELIDVISKVTGRGAEVKHIPHITDDTYELTAAIDKLKAIGYTPKMMLEQGLRELADVLGEYPELPSGETIFHVDQSEVKP